MIVAAWVFGSILLVFLMFLIFYREVKSKPLPLDDTTKNIIGFFCATVAGLFGVFFTGTIVANLTGTRNSIGTIGAQATGGVALFVIMLWWWKSGSSPLGAPAKDVAVALSALAKVFQNIDQHYPEIRSVILKDSPVNRDYGVVAKQGDKAIDFVNRSGQTLTSITAADLEKLPANDQQLIKAVESSMQISFDKWTSRYPERASATDAASREPVQKDLEEIARSICSDLEKIFTHLGSTGYSLQDHYGAMRSVCAEYQRTLQQASK